MWREFIFLFLVDLISIVYGFGGTPPVYVSNGTHIVGYSRDGPVVYSVLGNSEYRIVGLAVDIGRDHLFWSDIGTHFRGIYRSDLRGNDVVKIVDDVGEINGLTVDWVSGHIYWTDVERKTVEVADYSGQARKVIVDTDLKSPKSIIAAPIFGYLFWADHRNKRIERAWLDGSHRRTLIKSAEYFPHQLAISNTEKMLYWVDANKHAVYSCNMNGKAIKQQFKYEKIVQGSPGFGLTVFGNTALVSTWFNTALYALMLGSKQNIYAKLASDLGTRELFSVVTLNPDTQPMVYHTCMEEDRSGCSHLCLPTKKGEYSCVCPTYGGLTMSADRKTCTVPVEILLCSVEKTGGVGFIPLESGHDTAVTLISKSTQPKAVAYDQKQKLVYWSDIADNAVYRSRLDGSEKGVYLDSTTGIAKINSLFYHPGTGCLYFINILPSGYATLELVDTRSGDRKTILRDMHNPIDFQIDSKHRYIYVMSGGEEHNNASIVRTHLDGSDIYGLPINMVNPVGFVVDGDKLTMAESVNGDTILTDVDLVMFTTMSAQFAEKTIDGITSRDAELYLVDNANKELLTVRESMPTTVLQGVELSDVFYTKTSSYNIEDTVDMCLKHSCSCVPLPGAGVDTDSTRCMCPSNLLQVPTADGLACTKPTNFLLFADGNTISMVSLDTVADTTPAVVYYGSSERRYTALNYDNVKQRIYWIDTSCDSIFMSHMHSLEPVLVYRDEGPINNLVIEAKKQRLYWTGVLGDKSFIASFNLQKGLLSYKRVVETANTLLALALHPNGRRLYFSEVDGDGAFISSSKTNGKRYRNFDSIRGLVSPTSLVASGDMLFVGEETGGIVAYHVEDETIEDVYVPSAKISGMDLHDNVLVYSDSDQGSIHVLETRTGRDAGAIVTKLHTPGSVLIHHPDPRQDVCSSANPDCDICEPVFGGQYVCACVGLRFLTNDQKACENAELEDTTPHVTESTTKASTSTQTWTTSYKTLDDDDIDYETVEKGYDWFEETQKKTTTDTTTTNKPLEDVTKQHSTDEDEEPSVLTERIWTSTQETVTKNTFSPEDNSEDVQTTVGTSTVGDIVGGATTLSLDVFEAKSSTKGYVVGGAVGQTTPSDGHHIGEPKPSQPTTTYERHVVAEVTETPEDRAGLFSKDLHSFPLDERPHFEKCPDNETILVTIPDNSKHADIPIRPEGYTRDGRPLPLHCNYELTEDGIIVPWKGRDDVSSHDVVFSVTNSDLQTALCKFKVILQDIDPPKFTFCPSPYKVRTDKPTEKVSWTEPEVHDNVGIGQIFSSHDPGSEFEPGETVVNYTAVDFAGNQASCFFKVFVLHDNLCHVPQIDHGGIVCDKAGDLHADCRVICEDGFVVNPLRVFRRMFNCMHPDDVDAITAAMTTQHPCLEHEYPSVLQQEYHLLFHGPISKHRSEVQANLSTAIPSHLERERLCNGAICHVGSIVMKCDVDIDGIHDNDTMCLDEVERMEFFIIFNITLRNNSDAIEQEVDVKYQLGRIHEELQDFASLLQWQLGEHLFAAVSDSLSSSQAMWSCPQGQISENNICISCPPGTFHNTSLNVCQYCGMGRYQSAVGQTVCHLCQPGCTSPDGATSHEQCHSLPSMDEMTLFIIVTTCSFGVVFLCMAITLYLQFQRQQKRTRQSSSHKKTRYNMTPNLYVAPPPILKSKLDDNLSPGERTYSIDRKHPINIFANHDYDEVSRSKSGGSMYQNDVFNMLQGQMVRGYSPGDEVPTGTLSRENTFSNPTYSPLSIRRTERGSLQRSIHTPSPGQQRKMSCDSTFSNSARMMGVQMTPTSDTPLITQSPLLRMKLAAYNLNHED